VVVPLVLVPLLLVLAVGEPLVLLVSAVLPTVVPSLPSHADSVIAANTKTTATLLIPLLDIPDASGCPGR
jgi:hypothetical protein